MPACIGPLEVRNEGSTLGPAAAMDFVGTGVTATFLDGIVTVSISGGGGGTSYTEVANYAALPAAASHSGEIYVCLAGQGIYLINRKPAGFYSSDGASWNYLADLPDSYFDDSILTISDDSDSTKKVKFQLSGISTLTTRILSVQDKSYTLEETGHASKHKSGGSDAIKLDELAAPDDTTTGDATSSLHGLMPKADKAKLDKVYVHGADVASASTINLDSATGDLIDVTGTTTITAITLAEGMHRIVRFTGILTLTHGASLVLPTSANITTAAGDFAIFRGYASSVVRCVLYSRASGASLAGSTSFATPTATVGTSAVAGSASTAMRSDAAPAIDLTMSPSWTGAHDFSGSGGKLKLPNTTSPSAEGQVNWDQTLKSLGVHNGQTILADDVGWLPYAFGIGTTTTSTQSGTLTLSAGVAVAIPVLVPTHLRVQSIGWRNMDTGSVRDVEFRVYRQRLNDGNSGENTVDEVSGCSGSESFTPGGSSSNRAPNVGTPGTYLPPGLYWLVIRNQGANSYGLATVAVAGTLSKSVYQTKSIGALGSTLDLVAATWTKGTNPVLVAFNGRVLGQTAAY